MHIQCGGTLWFEKNTGKKTPVLWGKNDLEGLERDGSSPPSVTSTAVEGSAKQAVASADLSHPDVWSLAIKNVGYCKAHHLWSPNVALCAPRSPANARWINLQVRSQTLGAAETLSSAYGWRLTPTPGTSRPRLHEMPHGSTPGRRNEEHIVGIRFIQYVNGEARMGGGDE